MRGERRDRVIRWSTALAVFDVAAVAAVASCEKVRNWAGCCLQPCEAGPALQNVIAGLHDQDARSACATERFCGVSWQGTQILLL